ncbi:MAG: hypothetical protein K8R74_11595 [Bacteroidales bacterium]|nr:hypothetical protein [Bacteroidales bacterium]
MYRYYVNRNAQGNGDHEVHKEDCSFLPNAENRIDLGIHMNCQSAVVKAKVFYQQTNGCYYCADECHTS